MTVSSWKQICRGAAIRRNRSIFEWQCGRIDDVNVTAHRIDDAAVAQIELGVAEERTTRDDVFVESVEVDQFAIADPDRLTVAGDRVTVFRSDLADDLVAAARTVTGDVIVIDTTDAGIPVIKTTVGDTVLFLIDRPEIESGADAITDLGIAELLAPRRQDVVLVGAAAEGEKVDVIDAGDIFGPFDEAIRVADDEGPG